MKLTEAQIRQARVFLCRFVKRGWLHGTRDDTAEQTAVDLGLRKRWLRRELSEVHFTPAGRAALEKGQADGR
jgi:hypothetical protein